ncbi:hypothetical protein [Nonomuraea sp. NPDC050643]|uniref:hypothetical protein n=1 Tax=Nonomuraea sp. NPDC050643 TaxID=3155660 RepID=UPI0033FD162E
MWIAVAVVAAAVVGVVAWWFRRDSAGGEAWAEAERAGEWASLLGAEAGAAFMEGLRAYHDAGGALRVEGERGVLTTYEPPRLISLHLLADAFAARGDAAMHDPQGTVATLLEQLAAAERPGVLHLRAGWLEGEVDGLDAAGFAGAVGGLLGGTGEAALGALQVPVPGDRVSHVNGTPLKPVTKDGEVRTGASNTMMLDLARVLDLYREERDKRPDAAAEALLREIVPRLIASGGPGLTWAKPPTDEELRAVLGGSPELR